MSRARTLKMGQGSPAAILTARKPGTIIVASAMREKRGVTLLERTNARVHDMKVRTKDK